MHCELHYNCTRNNATLVRGWGYEGGGCCCLHPTFTEILMLPGYHYSQDSYPQYCLPMRLPWSQSEGDARVEQNYSPSLITRRQAGEENVNLVTH